MQFRRPSFCFVLIVLIVVLIPSCEPVDGNSSFASNRDEFPRPYSTVIEAEIKEHPWYGTRHTGWCGTGMDAGIRKFTEILSKAPIRDIVPFFNHRAQYVRMATHNVIEGKKKLYSRDIKTAFKKGSLRIQLELLRYVEPDATKIKIFDLLDEIIKNPKLKVFITDLNYVREDGRSGSCRLPFDSVVDYPIDIVGFYIRLLEDHYVADRATAINALGKFGSEAERAVPSLVRMLEIEDVEMPNSGWVGPVSNSQHILIAQALGDIGVKDKKAIKLLTDMKKDSRNDFACYAASSLYKIGESKEEQLDFVIKKFNTENSDSELAGVIDNLRLIGPDAYEVIPQLEELLAHEDHSVKWVADRALERIEGVENAIKRDLRNLKHDDHEVRENSVRDIARYTERPEVRKALFETLNDSNPEVIIEATWALDYYGKEPPEKLLPAWIRIIKLHGGSGSSSRAVNNIKEMGRSAHSALPVLLNYLESNPGNAYSTNEAILAIGGTNDDINKCLISALEKGSKKTRKSALGALSRHDTNLEQILPSLLKMYNSIPELENNPSDYWSEEQRDVINTLRKLLEAANPEDEPVMECFRKMLQSYNVHLFNLAFEILSRTNSYNDLICESFNEFVNHENSEISKRAINIVEKGKSASFKAIPGLKQVAVNSEDYIRASNADCAIERIVLSLPSGKQYDHDILLMAVGSRHRIRERPVRKILELGVPAEKVALKIVEVANENNLYYNLNVLDIVTELGDAAIPTLPLFAEKFNDPDLHFPCSSRISRNVVEIINRAKPESNIPIETYLELFDCCCKDIIAAASDKYISMGGSYDEIVVKLAEHAIKGKNYVYKMTDIMTAYTDHGQASLHILKNHPFKKSEGGYFSSITQVIIEILNTVEDDSKVSLDDLISFLDTEDKNQLMASANAIARLTGSYDIPSVELAILADSSDVYRCQDVLWTLQKIGGNAKAALPQLKELNKSSYTKPRLIKSVIKEIEESEVEGDLKVVAERLKPPKPFDPADIPKGVTSVWYPIDPETGFGCFDKMDITINLPDDKKVVERLSKKSSWRFKYDDGSRFPEIDSLIPDSNHGFRWNIVFKEEFKSKTNISVSVKLSNGNFSKPYQFTTLADYRGHKKKKEEDIK